jgi:hypothetical protein
MRLDDARLCLDCEEIHDERECPACGSEAFAFLKRWIKSAGEKDRLRRPRPTPEVTTRPAPTAEQLDAWKRIVDGTPAPPGRGRLLTRGLVGLLAMGVAGWAWTRKGSDSE